MSGAPIHPTRRWSRRVLACGLGLLLGLLLAEVIVRVLGLGTATLTRGRLHTYDPDAGWICTPDLDARYALRGSFDARVTTNDRGLRDGPIEPAKPEGSRRIVVLGDSFMWGYGVENDEMFASVLERRIDRSETVNLGVNGYSTVQEAIRFETEGLRYGPDLVLLAFTWNDLDDNLDSKEGGRPFAALDEDGSLVIQNRPVRNRWKSPVVQWFRHHSRLFNLVEYGSETFKARRAAKRRARGGAGRDDPPKPENDLTVEDIFGPPTPRSELGWSVFEKILERIRDRTRDAGGRVLLVNNPTPQALFPARLERVADRMGIAAGELDPDRPARRMEEIASRLGIAFVDPTPAFAAHPDPRDLFLARNNHWSARGHRVAADSVAETVRDLLGR